MKGKSKHELEIELERANLRIIGLEGGRTEDCMWGDACSNYYFPNGCTAGKKCRLTAERFERAVKILGKATEDVNKMRDIQ